MKGKLMIQYELRSVGTSGLLSLLLFSSIKTINTLDVAAMFAVSNFFMWIKIKGKKKWVGAARYNSRKVWDYYKVTRHC